MTNNSGVAYVRLDDDLLSEQLPPQSSVGLLGWLKANLFSSWSDRIITVLIVVLFGWLGWSIIDDWFLSANWRGDSQDEGQLAEIISDVDAKLDDAQRLYSTWQQRAESVIDDEQANLDRLVRDIEATDWASQPVLESRFRGDERKIPDRIAEQLAIAQSKLTLSLVARIERVARQLRDPRVVSVNDVVGLDELVISEREKTTLFEMSRPWTVLSEEDKTEFQRLAQEVVKLLGEKEAIDNGKVFRPIEAVWVEVNDLIVQVEGEDLLERPTRLALQFAGLVDGVVNTPMTTIPVSRIQRVRKETLSNVEIDSIRMAVASETVEPLPEGASRAQITAHKRRIEEASKDVSDATLFLSREMPAGYPEGIRNQGLLQALDAVNFWSVAPVLAEPDGVEPETNLPAEKAPQVLRALERDFASADAQDYDYAAATFAIVNAYLMQDLDRMEEAWRYFEPLKNWAARHDGANWAVIANNWNTMLWGEYPDESLWRVGLVVLGFFCALLPILVPRCRRLPFFVWTGVFPLFLLFMLGGLSVRLYGWSMPADGNLFQTVYSELGRVIQAAIAFVLLVVAFVLQRGQLGKTAGPALVVTQILALLYFVIMIWGTVVNPKAAQTNILVDNKFTGLLTADHPLGQQVSLATLQAEMDRLLTASEDETLAPDEAQALRAQAQELRKGRTAAQTAEREFANVVDKGEGTYVILPFVKSLDWGGLLITSVLGILGIAASLPLGILMAFGRQSTLPIVRWFSTGFIELIRGVPLIALLLTVIFVLPKLLPEAEYPKLGLALLAVCLHGTVYQAEVVRGGLQSLPRGQYEAAQAIGLNFWQMSRFITLPQALKAVIPAIVNTFIGTFKDTTLVIVVSVFDLLTTAEQKITTKTEWNASKPETLIVISLVFFILMFTLSRYSIWLERRLATEHR